MGRNFVQTNEADGNRVIVFQRGDDGALTELASVATGGNGDGVPHLTSQGSVVLTQDGTRLLVANAGSGDVSVLAITDEPSLVQVVPTGAAPKSLAENAGLVYVLNTGAPSLAGFRLTNEGLEPLEGSLRELAPDADPAQVGFTPDGSALVVTERGTNSLAVFSVGKDGLLGDSAETPSAGPTPYGFAFAANGALVVTEAFGAQKGKAAASSYWLTGTAARPVSRSVGNGPVPLRDRRGRRPHLRVVGGERTALADRIVGRHPRDCRRPRSELKRQRALRRTGRVRAIRA